MRFEAGGVYALETVVLLVVGVNPPLDGWVRTIRLDPAGSAYPIPGFWSSSEFAARLTEVGRQHGGIAVEREENL